MMTRKDNSIAEKSMAFAVRIVGLFRHLTEKKRECVMSKQVLRSADCRELFAVLTAILKSARRVSM